MRLTGNENIDQRKSDTGSIRSTHWTTSFGSFESGGSYSTSRKKIAQKNKRAKAGIRLAMRLVKSGGRVSEEDINRVHRAGLSETEIVSIMTNVALNAPVAYVR